MTPLAITFPDIDPVAFSIFGLGIHWYALMYLLAFALAYLLMRRRLKHEPYRSISEPKAWHKDDIEDILLYAIAGVLIGGRVGYTLFYKPGYYLSNPLEIITGIRDGGMSFHGGAIGVILGLAVYAAVRKRPFLQVTDFLVPAVPIGLALGRFGNFINGELWGREASADLPWAFIFPTGGDIPRHPSQLYQMLLEGLLLFVLLWWYASKPRFRGQVSGAFLIGYGLFRFIAEFWREPDAHLGLLGLGFSMGQWLSLPMIVAGIALWSWARARAVSDVEAVDNRVDNSSDLVGDDSFEPEPAPGADARPTSGGASEVGDRADLADDRDGPAKN